MAVTAGAVPINTTVGGVAIVAAGNTNFNQSQGGNKTPNRSVFLSNSSGATVFLGPAGVTISTGYPMAASTTLQISLHIDEALYGIVASTGSTVSYLATGS